MSSRSTIQLRRAVLLAALLSTVAVSCSEAKKSAGERWERVHSDSAVFAREGRQAAINSIVAAGPGLVAVGYDTSGAVVWTSTDGRFWKRVRGKAAAFTGRGVTGMSAVSTGGPGLVAVGGERSKSDWNAAVWTSPDGLVWRRAAVDESVLGGSGDQLLRGVIASGPLLVAVGFDRGDAAVWMSRDGVSWKRIRAGDGVFGGFGKQEMNAVTAGEHGLMAVGADNGDAAVWSSEDGLSWVRALDRRAALTGEGEQEMYCVTAGGPGFVAVGYDNGVAAAWMSTDGFSWRRASIDEPASERVAVWSEMLGVTAGGPGLVAVGMVGAGASGTDAAVWISKDGLSWKSVPGDPAFRLAGNQALAAVAGGGPGLIAVGKDRSAAAVWTSSP